tara:strand:- start:1048 stop:1767 length:720 start_codon:yes stop_codon:yes gene_type:complete
MTIHIDFLTGDTDIYQFSKIDYAMNFLPDWYKNLPAKNYLPEKPGGVRITMKGCLGLRDLFKKSLIIPLWSDMNIALGRIGTDTTSWAFADRKSDVELHTREDYGSFIGENTQHLKLVSPWYGFSKSDVGFCFVQPMWNTVKYSDILHVLPGIIDFKYQAGTNVNILLSRKPENKVLELKHGMPLVHLVPLTEEKVKIKHHFVDQKELNKKIIKHQMSSSHLGFLGWPNRLKKLRKNGR